MSSVRIYAETPRSVDKADVKATWAVVCEELANTHGQDRKVTGDSIANVVAIFFDERSADEYMEWATTRLRDGKYIPEILGFYKRRAKLETDGSP
jgi:hypothetical protein